MSGSTCSGGSAFQKQETFKPLSAPRSPFCLGRLACVQVCAHAIPQGQRKTQRQNCNGGRHAIAYSLTEGDALRCGHAGCADVNSSPTNPWSYHEFLNMSYPFPFCSNRSVWNILLLLVSLCCNRSWSCWNLCRLFVAAHQRCTSQAHFSAWVSHLISELSFPRDPMQRALQLKVACTEVPGQWKRAFMVSPPLYT